MRSRRGRPPGRQGRLPPATGSAWGSCAWVSSLVERGCHLRLGRSNQPPRLLGRDLDTVGPTISRSVARMTGWREKIASQIVPPAPPGEPAVTGVARSHDARSSDVAERLARLAPDQRAAAMAPPGPVLCVAPAGSGKTTTLVARVAWLVDGGTPPGSICVVAFNKRAPEELTARLGAALEGLGAGPWVLGVEPGSVRVRTFHALGREILLDAGVSVDPLIDRDLLLRELLPDATAPDRARLDLAFSRFKLDLRVAVEEVARDPAPGPIARAFIAHESAIRESGGVDFDDLVVRAVRSLESDAAPLARWRARAATLLVDEAQ